MFDFIPYLNSVVHEPISKIGKDNYISTLKVKLVKNRDEHQDESIDVLTALREHAAGHVLLLGKPGSGKSTAFKNLLQKEAQRCLLNSELPTPILIELRRLGREDAFDGSKINIFKLIIEHSELNRLTDQEVRQLLQQGKLLLLLDGINEMPSSNMPLSDFRKTFSNTPMIFTSRELEAGSYLGIDKQFQMLPLTESQAKEFIEKQLADHNSASQLWHALQGKIKELTDTPLLLDMLCSTYKNSKTIPQNRGELFRQFTHDQYEKHKPKDTLTPRHNEFFDFRDEVLQEIAFYMMDAGGDGKDLWLQVKRNDIEKRLEKYFREKGSSDVPSKVKQWLDDALNLYLLQLSVDKNKIEFTHQLFQEYYSAEWLLRNFSELEDQQICAFYINPIKWTNTLGIFLELLDSESDISRFRRLALDVGFPDNFFTSNRKISDDQQICSFSSLGILSSFAEDNRDNIDCMMGWSFNGIDEELLETINIIEINKGSNSLLQSMKALLNDEHTKSIAIDIILNLDEVKYFFESYNEDINLGCFEQEIAFELRQELDNPVSNFSIWRIKRFACILARIESRFSVSELVKLASSKLIDDSVFFYVKSLLINIKNIEFFDLYTDLLSNDRLAIICVRFLARVGDLKHCDLLQNIPGGSAAIYAIQHRTGYYSYQWLKSSEKILKPFPLKGTNMTTTINFNAPINQYGNGTLTGDVTNNHYGDKPQVEHHPLILTEGKTDWKHLEFALNKLQAQGKFSSLKIEFSKTEEHMGYAQMLQHCQALSKSPQNRLHICIFDRDEEKVNSEFKVKNNSDKAFAYYGNNVFITRIPQLIDAEDKISIENYYSNHDLERTDSQGRRLPRAGFKVINNQTPKDLSKNDFADNIRKETHEFKDVDVSNFAKIFELIETIIAEAKKPR